MIVRQINHSGEWVSASDKSKEAYTLTAVNGVPQSCTCEAAQFGDPCCKHLAMLWHTFGKLDLEETIDQDVQDGRSD